MSDRPDEPFACALCGVLLNKEEAEKCTRGDRWWMCDKCAGESGRRRSE